MNVHHQEPPHTLWRLIARTVSGRCIDGIRRTDATFMRAATKDITPHGRAPRYTWLAGWRRAVMRLISVCCAITVTGAWFAERMALFGALEFVGLAETVIAGVYIRRIAISFNHRRKVLYPLWHLLAGITGYPLSNASWYQSVPGVSAGMTNNTRHESPERFLTVPRDYRTNDKAVIRFEVPFTWEGGVNEQKRVTQVIARHLGGDWAATWSMNTSPRFVALCHQPRPPKSVTLAEFARYIDESADSVLALGLGAANQLVAINLDSDAPHIALSMGTGGGKSDTVALIIAILVRKRVPRIDVIDPKRVSHNWARGLPGVHIHRYVAGQMEAIHNTKLDMDSRYDAIDTNSDVKFSRRVLIIEEQNSLMQDLDEYWTEHRTSLPPKERATVSKDNPAIGDMRTIGNKGRQGAINMIAVFQRMSAQATGGAKGGDARENYGAKILCRVSHQTWKILVGTRMPPMSRIPGRAYLVIGDDAHEIQRAHASITHPDGSADKEGIKRLREFALNGRPDTGENLPTETPVSISISEPEIELVTLREAVESGILKMKYGAACKARQRDPEFPAGIPTESGARGYLPADLRSWHANRVRAPQPV